MRMRRFTWIVGAVVVDLWCIGAALAAELAVLNPSFEEPVTGAAGSWKDGATGWEHNGLSGIWRPGDSSLLHSTEGDQIGFIDGDGTWRGFSQKLTAELKPITLYKLQIEAGALGAVINNPGTNYHVSLLAGDATIASITPIELPVGTWTNLQAIYESSTSVTPGQQLSIRIASKAKEFNFDNVRLAAVSVAEAVKVVPGLSPAEGPDSGGTLVIFNGSNLSAVTSVSFGTNLAPVFYPLGGTNLLVITPPSEPGPVDVVLNAGTGNALVLTNAFLFERPFAGLGITIENGTIRLFTNVRSTKVVFQESESLQGGWIPIPEPATEAKGWVEVKLVRNSTSSRYFRAVLEPRSSIVSVSPEVSPETQASIIEVISPLGGMDGSSGTLMGSRPGSLVMALDARGEPLLLGVSGQANTVLDVDSTAQTITLMVFNPRLIQQLHSGANVLVRSAPSFPLLRARVANEVAAARPPYGDTETVTLAIRVAEEMAAGMLGGPQRRKLRGGPPFPVYAIDSASANLWVDDATDGSGQLLEANNTSFLQWLVTTRTRSGDGISTNRIDGIDPEWYAAVRALLGVSPEKKAVLGNDKDYTVTFSQDRLSHARNAASLSVELLMLGLEVALVVSPDKKQAECAKVALERLYNSDFTALLTQPSGATAATYFWDTFIWDMFNPLTLTVLDVTSGCFSLKLDQHAKKRFLKWVINLLSVYKRLIDVLGQAGKGVSVAALSGQVWSYWNFTDTIEITVIDRLELKPTSSGKMYIEKGKTKRATVVAFDIKGRQVPVPNGEYRWNISPTNIASVDAEGVITGHTNGIARLTVTEPESLASTNMNVEVVSDMFQGRFRFSFSPWRPYYPGWQNYEWGTNEWVVTLGGRDYVDAGIHDIQFEIPYDTPTELKFTINYDWSPGLDASAFVEWLWDFDDVRNCLKYTAFGSSPPGQLDGRIAPQSDCFWTGGGWFLPVASNVAMRRLSDPSWNWRPSSISFTLIPSKR